MFAGFHSGEHRRLIKADGNLIEQYVDFRVCMRVMGLVGSGEY